MPPKPTPVWEKKRPASAGAGKPLSSAAKSSAAYWADKVKW